MTVFLIVAVLMVATALFFVLPPLLRKQQSGSHAQRDVLNLEVLRDQLRELDVDRKEGVIDDTGYDSARKELEQRVAEDVRPGVSTISGSGKPWPAIVLSVVLPVMAVALYLMLGNPKGFDLSKIVVSTNTGTAQENITPEKINAMVDKLARHLKEAPDDIEGWNMMARSSTALGRYADASDAYSHLIKLVPPNAELLADYADALAMATNKSLQGEPEKLINRALELEPKNIKALALAGGAAYERNDYAAAVAQWRKIMLLVRPNSDIARSVGSSINEALSRAGTPATGANAGAANAGNSANADSATSSASATAISKEISGTVALDPSLRSKVSDADTVFIFARAVDGPRFPLAVLRKQVKDLPTAFALDDSMGMMPNVKLSDFSKVVVGARISKSGSATPSAGDLEGLTDPVQPGVKNLKISINSQRQ
jgi:cytochrome c-type biogenesis protein CcmH